MTKTIKSIVFGVITLGACLFFWRFLQALFYAPIPTLAIRIWATLFLFIFAVLVSLVCFLVDLKAIAFPFLALCALSFFLFFGFKIAYLVGIVFFLIAFFVAYLNINSEKKVRIRPSLRKSLGYGLPLILTFSIIMICLAYYFAPAIQIQAREITIPKKMFDAAITPAEGMISGFIPGFKKDMTFDEISFLMALTAIEKKVEQEGLGLPAGTEEVLRKEGIDISSKEEIFKAIRENPKVRKRFIEASKEQQKETEGEEGMPEMFKGMGIEISGDEPFLDVIYKAANQKLNDIVGPYKRFIPLAAAISLFFILRILMIPFEWSVMLAAWILFAILKATKVVRIEKVQKEVEVIQM